MIQRWACTLQDDATREQWTVEVLKSPPLAQLGAEVEAIKAAQKERPGTIIRCVRSYFVKEEAKP